MSDVGRRPQETRRARGVWALTGAASLLTVITIALIWLVAVPWGPALCPAIDPAPRNCFASDRMQQGWTMTVVVLVVYASVAWLVLRSGSRIRRPLLVAGFALLAIAPFASHMVVAWIPAFAHV